MKPRKYEDGVIVLLNEENIPVEKMYFQHAACIRTEITFTQKGSSYVSTKLVLQPEVITVGSGITFTNEWTI